VEQRPTDIWSSQWEAAQEALMKADIGVEQIAGIGIANQRETVILWDRRTGKPLHNAIGWQCRRTAEFCDALKTSGLGQRFREKTGLVIDPYFSGTKIAWMLDQVPGLRQRAQMGEIAFGTVDSWLVYQLTGGLYHVTDYSNASRTLFYNIHRLHWDPELLAILDIPFAMCPEVVDSSGVVAATDPKWFGRSIPIAGIAGDQQAALFGQRCYQPGTMKNTYGTGSFLLMNTGKEPATSKHDLLTTIAWGINGQVDYALEGSIFVTGAVVQWLRDELEIIKNVEETEVLARSVPDTGGVYFVPAFVGLGAPHWDSYARGTIGGLTRGSKRAHLVRAALESIAYQSRDVMEAMVDDARHPLTTLRVDGGAIKNNFLAQFQADILGVHLERAHYTETTALGAAFLAGLGVGMWPNLEVIEQLSGQSERFEPQMDPERKEALYRQWHRAVTRSLAWSRDEDIDT
jgi:glycerol kinase